jgi:hypothetical protein
MTPCTHLSDRMPEVALGRARWTPEDERHLAGCGDCQAEWAIVAAASRLGAGLPAIDPERVAARAMERVRSERARAKIRTRRLTALVGLAAAAMVALAVWANRSGRVGMPGGVSPTPPVPVATTPSESLPDPRLQAGPRPQLARESDAATLDLPLPELDSLPAEALDSILRTLDEPLAHVGADDQPPDDSGDRELEQVLAGMEG